MSNSGSREVVEAVATRVADAQIMIDTGSPRTDGKTIWLPFDKPEFGFDDMIGLASHEGSHIRFKSTMDSELLESLCPKSLKLAAGVLNIFEDFRVNFLLREIYPGFWDSLDILSNKLIKKKIRELLATSNLSLEFIVEATSIFAYVDPRWEESEKGAIEAIGTRIPFWNGIKEDFSYVREYRTMSATVIAARRFLERIASLIKDEDKMEEKFLQMLVKALGEVMGMKGTPGEVLKQITKLIEELKPGEEIEGKIGEPLKEAIKQESEKFSKELEKAKKGADPSRKEVHKDIDGILAIDVIENKDDLKKVNNIYSPGVDYKKIVGKNKYLITELKKSFDSIQQGQEVTRGLKSGLITSRDLSKVVSSKGKFDRPFNSLRKKRGAKILIVVDESGSMSRGFGKEFTSKIDIAKESTIILSEALKGTMIKFGVVGFSAVCGQMTITEKLYKRFEEVSDPEKIGSIGCASTSSENRDGTSLELIAKKFFSSSSGDIPVMIVISDGNPHHGGTSHVGPKGLEETVMKVRKIRQAIKTFVLSFDLGAKKYISEIYGENHAILKNAADLTNQLIFLVKTISKAL